MTRFVAYYRVSTDRQGRSGLGLEGQKAAVEVYLASVGGELLDSYVEVESGKKNDRAELAKALQHCREAKATILIAKIDRLSRNAGFLLTLRESGVDIRAADMPDAGTLEFGIRAVVAQHEREEISRRTKAALAAAKARGVKLGCPSPNTDNALKALKSRADSFSETVEPVIAELRKAGIASNGGIARALNARGQKTERGGRWHDTTVRNILKRLKEQQSDEARIDKHDRQGNC